MQWSTGLSDDLLFGILIECQCQNMAVTWIFALSVHWSMSLPTIQRRKIGTINANTRVSEKAESDFSQESFASDGSHEIQRRQVDSGNVE